MISPVRKQKDEERRIQTRRVLLDAAAAVFAAKGYHTTLISDIVANAGVGQGTFYRNFENKREIFEQLFDDFIASTMEEFADMSANLPESTPEYVESSIRAVTAMAGRLETHRDLLLVFLREGPAIDKDFARKMADVFDQFAALAKFYLDYAIEEGLARPCDAEIVSQCIVGIGLRHIERWLDGRTSGQDIARNIHSIVDFAFYGMAPSPSPDATPATGH